MKSEKVVIRRALLGVSDKAGLAAFATALERHGVEIVSTGGTAAALEKAGVKPEALVAAFQERKIMIRQGAYHTPTFGDRFIKVSTSVPSLWVEEFVALLPAMVERARGRNEPVKLF